MTGCNCFAQCVAIGTGQVMPHKMRINIRVGAGMGNVESNPTVGLGVRRAEPHAFDDDAGAPVLVGAGKDVKAAKVLFDFINCVLNIGVILYNFVRRESREFS
jgi:hypothetical protein